MLNNDLPEFNFNLKTLRLIFTSVYDMEHHCSYDCVCSETSNCEAYKKKYRINYSCGVNVK